MVLECAWHTGSLRARWWGCRAGLWLCLHWDGRGGTRVVVGLKRDSRKEGKVRQKGPVQRGEPATQATKAF